MIGAESVRYRVSISVAIIVAGLGALFSASAYVWFAATERRELEAFAGHEADEVANIVAGVTTIDAHARDALGRLLPEVDVLAIRVWDLDGELVYSAPAESSPEDGVLGEGLPEALAGSAVFEEYEAASGTPALVTTRRVDFGREPRWVVAASVSRARAEAAIRRFGGYGVVATLAATLLVFLGSLAMLGSAMRPVTALVNEAFGLLRESKGGRLDEPPPGSELHELAVLLNRMLLQTEESLGRLRRFTAYAGHELRTPLARMRAEVESSLASSDPEKAQAALGAVLDEIDALRHVIDGLLDLAQGDRRAPEGQAVIDLAALADEVLGEARVVWPDRELRLRRESPEPVWVRGSRVLLARLLWNVVDNAVRAARRVDVSVIALPDDRVALEVEDDGPGVDAGTDPETLFEPFVRGSGQRGRHGLGLALGRSIARRHGGELAWLPPGELRGARVRLSLPKLSQGPDTLTP